MNPEPFLQLDRRVYEKGRMAILALLASTPELSFRELKDLVGMTDGNLTTHLRVLQEAGLVHSTKSFRDQRPLTTLSLTEEGRKAFASHIDLLERIVRQVREPSVGKSGEAKVGSNRPIGVKVGSGVARGSDVGAE